MVRYAAAMNADAELADPTRARLALWSAVLISGAAGLTWEVLWQHYAALSLGVSAFGAAVTLASLMLGLGVGALIAGRLARAGRIRSPLRAYGIAELLVGIGGLCVPYGLAALARLDTALYAHSPGLADATRAVGVGLLLLIPSAAMGASLPLLAPWARRVETKLPTLYAFNTTGAVFGVVLVTFVALPFIGVQATTWLGASLDIAVGLWAITRSTQSEPVQVSDELAAWPPVRAACLAFSSAFVIFVLEVTWFRSFRAALAATTETFSVLIASFLIALALGAAYGPRIRARFPHALPIILALAAFAVLYTTKAADQLDLYTTGDSASPTAPLVRFMSVLGLVVVPVTLLGMPFPWLLAEYNTITSSGRLYAINTLGAVTGTLLSGFVLLPWIGASVTSWIAGFVSAAMAVLLSHGRRMRIFVSAIAAVGGALAMLRHEGGARQRVQGFQSGDFLDIAFVAEGPDSTLWVTRERRSQRRVLVIDGFKASGEGPGTGYMQWMGHLPALAVPRLRNALVICFGTGQTAQAVRVHRPESLSIVDINPAVFAAAPLFESNHGVLEDPSVRAVVMDGRAFLRRMPQARFDAITLEPMPPNHAGVNNLYSLEFYELMRAHLTSSGSVAQWLPLHLIAPQHMRAIVGTFVRVFPHARLWIDPEGTGVLVGGVSPWKLKASKLALPLTAAQIDAQFLLEADELRALSAGYPIVSDDNQLLSYGLQRLSRSSDRGRLWSSRLAADNRRILDSYRSTRVSEAAGRVPRVEERSAHVGSNSTLAGATGR
ncbi:MAG TPA: fused MFS/spermidine synthase [Polyangiales bacterium]|nr:fused MFS/spermidine synthase [Polyangiales bacterium]